MILLSSAERGRLWKCDFIQKWSCRLEAVCL